MSKLTKKDFIQKYNDMFEDDNYVFDKDSLSISLMEDISDSISDEESEELVSLRNELEKTKSDYLDLKEKYKERFLNAVDDKNDSDDLEELEEKEVIDVKEI